MSHYSTFLFARPSFLEGMARIIDIGGVLNVYHTARTPQEADAIASACDWSAVGQDIMGAMEAERLAQAADHAGRSCVGEAEAETEAVVAGR